MRLSIAGIVTATALGLAVVAMAPAQGTPPAAAEARSSTPPNVIIILTDDQRAGTEVGMPIVMRELAGKGVRFPNAFVPTSWCCPSRASLLTGKYSHGTGVWENTSTDSYGAWPAFANGGEEKDTLATRLNDMGYRTGLFGKYLNGLDEAPPRYKPPGWDVFAGLVRGSYWNYRLSNDPIAGRPGRRTYLTDELGQQTARFIRSTPADTPLFAMFTPFAPHMPFDPGPYAGETRRRGLTAKVMRETQWPSPSVNQEDMTGYPRYMQRLKPSETFDKREGYTLDQVLMRTQDMLLGVDTSVGTILEALRETGRLDNTLIVFASDNGYLLGEHRLQRKNVPYDRSIRVPLLMRFDGRLGRGVIDDRVAAANIDIYATVMDALGTSNPAVDGRTLLSTSPYRSGVLLEATLWRSLRRPAYCGWRERDFLFVRYSTGEEEFYDYREDPYELRNAIEDPRYASLIDTMRERVREECNPRPPTFTWSASGARARPPSAPMNVVARAQQRTSVVEVSWRAPRETYGAPPTLFRVTSTPSGLDCEVRPADGNGLDCSFTRAQPGVAYTFSVAAVSDAGTSDPALSNAVVLE